MKTIQKITSIFLCVTFLVSSMGFTVNKMVCLKNGRVKLSFTPVKSCCPEKKAAIPIIKATCCDLTNTSFNLGDSQTSQKLQISQSLFVKSFLRNEPFSLNGNTNAKISLSHFSDLPPPLYGRKLLSYISILII